MDEINIEARRLFWEREADARYRFPQPWSSDAALMTWKDPVRGLTFAWNGDATVNVGLLFDGDKSILKGKRFLEFDYRVFKPDWVIAGTKSAVLSFQESCRRFIEAKEEACAQEIENIIHDEKASKR